MPDRKVGDRAIRKELEEVVRPAIGKRASFGNACNLDASFLPRQMSVMPSLRNLTSNP